MITAAAEELAGKLDDERRYLGRRPSARLKADEAVKLFKAGCLMTDIATAPNIGRGSVLHGSIRTEPRHQAVKAIDASSTAALAFDADDVQGKFAERMRADAARNPYPRTKALAFLAQAQE